MSFKEIVSDEDENNGQWATTIAQLKHFMLGWAQIMSVCEFSTSQQNVAVAALSGLSYFDLVFLQLVCCDDYIVWHKL